MEHGVLGASVVAPLWVVLALIAVGSVVMAINWILNRNRFKD